MEKTVRPLSLILFLVLISPLTAVNADQNNDSTDRQKIIDELTYRLDTEKVCELMERWDDQGSNAQLNGHFFLPRVKKDQFTIGGYGAQNRNPPHCVTVVSIPKTNPKNTPELLVAPKDWKLIWTDKGSGAEKNGSMWEAIPPDNNYRCLGTVPQHKYTKPDIPKYRCVYKKLTKKVEAKSVIWTDVGSNASKPVTILKLPLSDSFVAVPDRVKTHETFDLRKKPVVHPKPDEVDAVLAQRQQQQQQQQQQESPASVAQEPVEKPTTEDLQPEQTEMQAVETDAANGDEEDQEEETDNFQPDIQGQQATPANTNSTNSVNQTTNQEPAPNKTESIAVKDVPESQATEPVTTDTNTSPDVNSTPTEDSGFSGFLFKVFGTAFIVIIIAGFIIFKLLFGGKKTP